jgi:hypothetical protein
MKTIVLALTALENGRRLGHAVICAEVRYASVSWSGLQRLDRRFVSLQLWQDLDRVLTDTLEAGPVPADGPISAALLPPDRRRGIVVQYLYLQPIGDGPDVASRLDAILAGLAAPGFRLRQS